MQRKFTYGFWKNGIHYEIYDVIDEINFENTECYYECVKNNSVIGRFKNFDESQRFIENYEG